MADLLIDSLSRMCQNGIEMASQLAGEAIAILCYEISYVLKEITSQKRQIGSTLDHLKQVGLIYLAF